MFAIKWYNISRRVGDLMNYDYIADFLSYLELDEFELYKW